jgi:hypothetical protein
MTEAKERQTKDTTAKKTPEKAANDTPPKKERGRPKGVSSPKTIEGIARKAIKEVKRAGFTISQFKTALEDKLTKLAEIEKLELRKKQLEDELEGNIDIPFEKGPETQIQIHQPYSGPVPQTQTNFSID